MASNIDKFQSLMASTFIDEQVQQALGDAAEPIKSGFEILESKIDRVLDDFDSFKVDNSIALKNANKAVEDSASQSQKLKESVQVLSNTCADMRNKMDKHPISDADFKRFEQYVRQNRRPLLTLKVDFNKSLHLVAGMVCLALLMLGTGFAMYPWLVIPKAERYAVMAYRAHAGLGFDNPGEEYQRVMTLFAECKEEEAINEVNKLCADEKAIKKEAKRHKQLLDEQCASIFPCGVEILFYDSLSIDSGSNSALFLFHVREKFLGKHYAVLAKNKRLFYYTEHNTPLTFDDVSPKEIVEKWTKLEVPKK